MSRLPIPFANHRTYVGHSGVDFAQPRGTLVLASGRGVVGGRSENPRGGLIQWVDYDGMPGVGYAHLDTFAGIPPRGSPVVEGTPLCRVGNSGFSTGPHLHMEVNGHATTAGFWRFFDPNRVVQQGKPAGGGGSTPLPIPEQRKARSSMATVYINVGKNPPVFALAGDGQGDAAWLEFTDQQLANALVGFHGISQKAVPLGDTSFREWRDKYRSGGSR